MICLQKTKMIEDRLQILVRNLLFLSFEICWCFVFSMKFVCLCIVVRNTSIYLQSSVPQLSTPPETPYTSTEHYRTEGYKGCPELMPKNTPDLG